MNREDQNFDQLRRLLKLKRHEQPPPRYFNEFSTQVVARLRLERPSVLEDNWLLRFWQSMELRPAIPAAFGAAVCGLLVAAAVYTDNPGSPNVGVAIHEPQLTQGFLPRVPHHAPEVAFASSTNPVPTSSLFDQIPLGLKPAERASFPFMK